MTKYEEIMNSLGAGSFESQNFEAEAHLAPTSAPTTIALATKLGVHPAIAHAIIHGNGNGHAPQKQSTIDQIIMESAGDLNITVTRATANIAAALPFVLFGLNDFHSSYFSTLSSFLPQGATVVVATSNVGNITFTWTAGGQTDVVTVGFQGKTNYAAFLQALNQNLFKTKYIQLTLSDATQQGQFNQMLNFGKISALGAASDNQLLPITRRRTTDFQNGIVEILLPEQSVTPDFAIVQNIVAVAAFTVGFNVYMSTRVNSNKR